MKKESPKDLFNRLKREGNKVIAPNNLPLCAIRHDGVLLEHEHADHPTYLFPVMVECGDSDVSYKEEHALIWTDGVGALTIYECCYTLFQVDSGKVVYSKYSDGSTLTSLSIAKIKEFAKKQGERHG